ncbi:CheR family methyltransferase [Salinibacter altiplanensis]|uniref:CheR family methyltransferase n=1 Tax=Salinibacter altiplanensis TaxID=1803181 RepID=UPI001F1EC29C|nr:CheR family methyltransferase [Salinibacter altiplanensis]
MSTLASEEHDFPVVGVGASAGGVEALRTFFKNLPGEESLSGEVGMAFVVVLHLSPDHESNLTEILQHETDLPVEVATDECPLEPGHVYVIPPQHEMRVEGATLRLSSRSSSPRPNTIDALLESLAEEYQSQAIGTVLSGTGADGTLGLRSVKTYGGIAMVQDPADAEHEEMSRNALDAGVIDLVAPADELAGRLAAYWQNADAIQLPESEEALPTGDQTTLQKIFAELRAQAGHDFSHYKRSSVLRRLERRLQVTNVETLGGYLQVLQDQPGEARALYKELLISVTRFFRTPDAFEALEETVIPPLFEGKAPNEEVRVWVAGCATGEEAYSLAILLQEHAQTLGAPPELQVFATDVDPEGLDTARTGVYPPTIEADVSEPRLDRFFLREDNQYRVTRSLRSSVVFAEHDLTQDPPFSNLDLVCCRNLLIYLDQEMQEHVFRLFHYALNTDGFLFLGPSEAIGPAQPLFSVAGETRSILKRTAGAAGDQSMPPFPPSEIEVEPSPQPTTSRAKASSGAGQDLSGLHQRLLKKQMASIIVDETHEIVHLTERAEAFLQHEGGTPTHNLLDKVAPSLRVELRGALHQALKKGETTERTLSMSGSADAPSPAYVQVSPVDDPDLGRPLAQVRFEEIGESVLAAGTEETDQELEAGPKMREEGLEEELEDTKEQLRITTEKYETATEEMETANEELMSMNEELKAKNEELQTSKEQLQSINEELKTTNQQLSAKVEALDQANDDLQNLMEATEVATLFLGPDLEIRRYTPPITGIYGLRESDVGRPITDFTPKIEYDSLVEDAERVLGEEATIEREVQSQREVQGEKGLSRKEGLSGKKGREWYLMRLRPYRSAGEDAEGVVVTFVDITAQKRAAETLRKERDLVSALIDTAGALIVVLGEDGSIARFNTACEEEMGYSAGAAEGEDFRDLLVARADQDGVTTRLEALRNGATERVDEEMEWITEGGQTRLIRGSITALTRPDGTVRHFIVTGTDVTERRELEREIIEISDRERRRIGADLHDVISSGLTNVTMRTETLAHKLEEEGPEEEEPEEEGSKEETAVEAEDLHTITEKTKEAADQIRSLSHMLVPKALQDGNLAGALANLAEDEEDFSGLTCDFVGDETETHLGDESAAMNLYRIAHEAVANAREHADPTRIAIDLRREDSDLVLTVRDDGKGWDDDGPPDEGLGLHLMRYRAGLIGGSLALTTRDGATVVECRLPLS